MGWVGEVDISNQWYSDEGEKQRNRKCEEETGTVVFYKDCDNKNALIHFSSHPSVRTTFGRQNKRRIRLGSRSIAAFTRKRTHLHNF